MIIPQTRPKSTAPRAGVIEERQLRVVPLPKRRRKNTQVQYRSWSIPAPDGAYSRIRAWDSRTRWLTQLDAALRSPEGETHRRTISISPDTFMRVAALDAEAADSRTGRGVSTAHETVANTIGCSPKTVQRARTLMQRLGFAVAVVAGRYLTTRERTDATAVHGQSQIKAASVRALTVPDHITSVENVQLPRQGLKTPLSYLRNYSPKRADARKAATRPGPKKKISSNPLRRPGYSPAVAHIAAELTERLPFLGRWRSLVTERPGELPVLRHQGAHLGSICRVITRSGLDFDRLTASDVLSVLDRITGDTGQVTLTGSHVKNPLGYLTILLRRVHDVVVTSGFMTSAERQQAALERRAQVIALQAEARAERDAQRARANTPEAIAARESFFAAWRAGSAARATH